MPWGFYSPCVENENKLGPKPGLIGHRGAPMVGLSMMNVGEYQCAWGCGLELKTSEL